MRKKRGKSGHRLRINHGIGKRGGSSLGLKQLRCPSFPRSRCGGGVELPSWKLNLFPKMPAPLLDAGFSLGSFRLRCWSRWYIRIRCQLEGQFTSHRTLAALHAYIPLSIIGAPQECRPHHDLLRSTIQVNGGDYPCRKQADYTRQRRQPPPMVSPAWSPETLPHDADSLAWEYDLGLRRQYAQWPPEHDYLATMYVALEIIDESPGLGLIFRQKILIIPMVHAWVSSVPCLVLAP